MNYTFSIIICTYNRSADLKNLFESLIKQECEWNYIIDIIIVDNNSTDGTSKLIKSYIEAFNTKLKYITEPKQGKSYALNLAIETSQSDMLIFTDDDVIVDNKWIFNIVKFSKEYDFDAIGGKVEPLYPIKAPQWIKDCKDILKGPIVCHDCGDSIKIYDDFMTPFIGANMIIKKKVFHELGNFNINIGPGKELNGEDTEFFRRIQNAGKRIYYNPNILVMHPVEPKRINFKYFAKWYYSFGKYLILKSSNNKKEELKCIFGVPRYLYRLIIQNVFCLIFSILNKHQFIKYWSELYIKFGMFDEYYKQSKLSLKAPNH